MGSQLSDKERIEFIEKNKRALLHADEYKVKEQGKKAKVLPTGELRLASGKVVGHREFRQVYKQWLPMRDTKEKELMKRLALEYKEMSTAVAIQKEHRLTLAQKKLETKKVNRDAKALKLGWQNNKVARKYMRDQNEGGG